MPVNRLLTIALLFWSVTVMGQYHSIGAMIGTSYYVGDINPALSIPNRFNLGGGLIYRYNINDRIAFKANVLYGRVYAHDKDVNNNWQANRNLHFRSDIWEFGGQFEVNFLTYEIGDNRRPSSPYLFLGISIFRFNPQAEFNGRWVDLQPLGTEGQGIEGFDDRYSLTSVSIPMGIGFKFNIWKNLGGAVEWGIRRTFTDYLDDVSTTYVDADVLIEGNGPLSAELADRSLTPLGPDGTNAGYQRGETLTNDWYIMAGFMLMYKIGKPRIKCPGAFN